MFYFNAIYEYPGDCDLLENRNCMYVLDFCLKHEFSPTYNGEKVAKFFFVVGMKNPNINEVQALAEDMWYLI